MKPTVLVTGALGGIGRATVDVFVDAGWSVIAVDRNDGQLDHDDVTYFKLDVSVPAEVENLFSEIHSRNQRLNAIVNNAAVQIAKKFIELSIDEWDQLLASNLSSVFLLSKLAYPFLKSSQGSIINVSSVHALATSSGMAAYAASKAAVVGLTRAMAVEFAVDQIRVNAVLPGAVDTPMLRAGLNRGHVSGGTEEERLQKLAEKIVLGRIGEPADIAHAILFLADQEQSAYMTGQTLVIDGGAIAHLSTE